LKEKIGIIGIGKLGLCFALNLAEAGYEVTGVDLNEDYVRSINDKTLKSQEPGLEALLASAENFRATTDLAETLPPDIRHLFVIVATPSPPDGGYDHYQVDALATQLEKHGQRENPTQLIISCTTMPGYCDTLAARLAPLNYKVSYNPEFIAQGSIIRDQRRPDMVLIGEADKEAGDGIQAIYARLCENNPHYARMDRLSAEITKLSVNCFLTTKISFANSIGDLCEKVGADTSAVLSAVGNDSRIGRKYLGYGFGFGGPCLPRDNRALGKFAKQNGYPLLIGETTDEVNRRHLRFQLDWYLKHYAPSETITFDYVTYKRDSTILEESQQLALAERLARAGRRVRVKGHPDVLSELKGRYGEDFFEYG
jgi:nucleotide sugar dehydrogenase